MLRENSLLLLLVALILTTGCSKNPSNLSENSSKAPLFENLGNYTYKISTKSELAQRYFNQGLNLTHGFNHAEAGRSFKEAARIDKNCAMCYWGAAYVCTYGAIICHRSL